MTQKISTSFKVLLVTGPRQVGKTTLLKNLSEPGRNYVTLDDPNMRKLAKQEPALFVEKFAPPVIIDEIQYAPEILPLIKIAVDSTEARGGYWLTGSQAFHTMKNVSESLAGRVGIVHLQSFSQNEIDGTPTEAFVPEKTVLTATIDRERKTLMDVYRRIWQGSMPDVVLGHTDWADYYSSYINTYLVRDIRDLAQVGDELAFLKFMTVVAARTAKPIVYDEIAKEVGISSPTAKKWLSILVSTGIVALVQPYHNDVLKRVTKMPLLHFLDTGLCAYLLKWSSAEVLEAGAMSGAFFESFVFSEIYKSYINSGHINPPLYYYRDKDGKEIDLIIWKDGTLYPIEIKKSGAPDKAMLKNFGVLDGISDLKRGHGAVICIVSEVLPIDADNTAVPVWWI